MSRQSVHFCALLVFVSLALAACGSQAPAAPAEIRIGLITTLTGELAESTGKETVDAVKLAIQPLNDAGGLVVGGRKLKVTLVIEDDQDKAELATSTAQKLVNQDQVVALIGSSISRNAIPTADVAERARVPMISPNSTNPATTAGKQYAFRVAFIDPFQGQVLARFALSDLGARKAAVLYDVASAYNKGIAEVFKQVFTEGGGEVVAFETYTTGEKDFSAQLARIKESGATVLFLPNYDNDIPAQAQQARQANIHATLLGADTWSAIKPGDRTHLEGSFFSSGWNPNVSGEQSQAFVKAFRQVYGREPNDISALAYDAAGLLFQAIQSQGKIDPESIRTGLANTRGYTGVTGMITYQGGGDPVKSAVINQIKDGKFVLYKQINP
jgi:branched-chain amino acid transport system substrate-binding protein